MKNHQHKLTVVAVLAAATCVTTQSWGQAAAPAPPPPPKWEKSAAIGLTLTEGNSDTVLLTGNVLASRKAPKNEILLGADGTYGENNDVKNNESLHGFAQYNRLFTDRFYGYARIDGLHDAIADIEYRFMFSPGVGYYFIKNDRTRLSAEAGPGYIYEKQGDDERGYFTLRLAEKLEHKLNDRSKLWQSFEIIPEVEDFNNYIVNAELGVETQLTQKLNLRAYVQDTYDNEPAPGRKKNDVKLVTAVALKF
jgi:putative salt-induced outer membrane protein YdiY